MTLESFLETDFGQLLEKIFIEGIGNELSKDPFGSSLVVLSILFIVFLAFKLRSEGFDKLLRGLIVFLASALFVIGMGSHIHERNKDSLLIINDPIQLYINAASLNNTQQSERQKKIYIKAARLAKEKNNGQSEKSDLMEYIEAKSSYHLGLLYFNDKQYTKAFDSLSLAIARYRTTNEFSALKDSIEMQFDFNEINRLNEEFDQEEVYHALYWMARSKYRQWLERRDSSNLENASLVESINLYQQVLGNASKNQYYERGSVWFDLGKAYQNNGDIDKAKKALLAAHYNGNGDASTTLKELGVMNEDGVLTTISNEESKQALLKVDGLSVYNHEDSQIAIGGDLSESGLEFLNKHYSEMQSVVKVDDINTLTSLYNLRYYADFQENVNLVAFSKFWINEVSEIVYFEISSFDNVQEKFKISICLLRNGKQETLISIFPLVRGDSSWLIGKAQESSFQDGCSQ